MSGGKRTNKEKYLMMVQNKESAETNAGDPSGSKTLHACAAYYILWSMIIKSTMFWPQLFLSKPNNKQTNKNNKTPGPLGKTLENT